ncbi:MAG: ATP synthase F1 subunit delta [Candidatus Marinimicrobia bacterium]|nr:ATP synthase F1 subunit delta [Candidatus Neomarinimicrobiota bacterium]
MAISRNANRFAQALYSVAEKKNNVFDVKSSLEQLMKLYRKNPEFRFILLSKRINKNQKIKILKDSLSNKVNIITLELIEILLVNDCINELPAINSRFQLFVSEKMETAQVSVIVSDELNGEQKSNLQQSIEAKLNKKIDIQLDVDPKIIGGMVLRIDNTIIDGSIKRQLEKIREHLVLN